MTALKIVKQKPSMALPCDKNGASGPFSKAAIGGRLPGSMFSDSSVNSTESYSWGTQQFDVWETNCLCRFVDRLRRSRWRIAEHQAEIIEDLEAERRQRIGHQPG